ncbi:hypothetical protein BSKO_07793 [Bryopsis sp. KO-2023]|nr:hypothetical protein BSKO_07793 [Bryopsis sp. KO-2023]
MVSRPILLFIVGISVFFLIYSINERRGQAPADQSSLMYQHHTTPSKQNNTNSEEKDSSPDAQESSNLNAKMPDQSSLLTNDGTATPPPESETTNTPAQNSSATDNEDPPPPPKPEVKDRSKNRVVVKRDPLPPAVGVVATHHKTGTMMFQTMFEMLCPLMGLDYQQMKGFVPIETLDLGETERYTMISENATGRMVSLMQGFKEGCNETSSQCYWYDFACMLASCNLEDGGKDEPNLPFRVVHVVRNPVDALISGYSYHRYHGDELVANGAEMWLMKPKHMVLPEHLREKYEGMPYYKMLKELDPVDGVRAEFAVLGGGMYRGARHYRDFENRDYALNMHFEDFGRDFTGTMKQAFKHLGLDERMEMKRLLEVANLFNVKTMPKEMEQDLISVHVTQGKFDKTKLKKVLYKDEELRLALDAIARAQGYKWAFDPQEMEQTE